MGMRQDFKMEATQPFCPAVRFSEDLTLGSFTFFLEDKAAGQALEEARQSGDLTRSVKALGRCRLLDRNLGVVRGEKPLIWGLPQPLVLHGMDRDCRYLDVEVGSNCVSIHDQIPKYDVPASASRYVFGIPLPFQVT